MSSEPLPPPSLCSKLPFLKTYPPPVDSVDATSEHPLLSCRSILSQHAPLTMPYWPLWGLQEGGTPCCYFSLTSIAAGRARGWTRGLRCYLTEGLYDLESLNEVEQVNILTRVYCSAICQSGPLWDEQREDEDEADGEAWLPLLTFTDVFKHSDV